MHICTCKYNLFHLYNIICTYVFRADCLTLDNQLVCSSLGSTVSPTPSFTELPVVLYVEWSCEQKALSKISTCRENVEGWVVFDPNRQGRTYQCLTSTTVEVVSKASDSLHSVKERIFILRSTQQSRGCYSLLCVDLSMWRQPQPKMRQSPRPE